MTNCPTCGNEASGSFCGHCGAPLGPAICLACRNPLAPGARFCSVCGTRFGAAAPGRRGKGLIWAVVGAATLFATVLIFVARSDENARRAVARQDQVESSSSAAAAP